jgi:demethylmenaquinone methyltransferase/2-methoxy-6-polyprenyl-1,4-benzoquinol methylase
LSLRAAFDTPDAKRRYVRRLFSTIADRYDLITALLSYGQDARWKRTLVSRANVRPGERALDLACGTGDIAFAIAARGARTVGLDITLRMLQLAGAKRSDAGGAQAGPISFLAGDMMSLPFAPGAFDLVTTGYGLRNVPDLTAAIAEIARVLRPGGRFLSLDFNRPHSAVVRTAYLWYLTAIGSTLGWVLHRDPDTYRYIPASIRRYPGAHGVAALLRSQGFSNVRVVPILFGLMTLHLAERPR